MPRLRIIVVHVPQLLREIVTRALMPLADMEVVAQCSDLDEAARVCRSAGVDVIVAGVEQPADRAQLREFVASYPCVRALAVMEAGRSGSLWRCVPYEVPLGELSTDCLIGAVRGGEFRSPVDQIPERPSSPGNNDDGSD